MIRMSQELRLDINVVTVQRLAVTLVEVKRLTVVVGDIIIPVAGMPYIITHQIP